MFLTHVRTRSCDWWSSMTSKVRRPTLEDVYMKLTANNQQGSLT
jgi:hypothetical protein